MSLDPLDRAFAAIAEAAPADADDWWIIGSAAMVLCGVGGIEPEDVDILGSRTTIERFLRCWGVEAGEPSPNARFRSYPYVRVQLSGCIPIETMGDLHVLRDGEWQPLSPKTRMAVQASGRVLHVPALEEQAEILKLFGREKDLAKLRHIERALEAEG